MSKYTESLLTGNIYNVDCFYFGQSLLKDKNFKGFELILANIPVYSKNTKEAQFDYNQWLEDRLNMYVKLLHERGNLIIYTNEKYNFFIRNILRKKLIEKKTIIWVKKSNNTTINPNIKPTAIKTLINGYEHILWYVKSSNYIFKQQQKVNVTGYEDYEKNEVLTDVWTDIKVDPEKKYQKPEKLSDRIIKLFSHKGIVYIHFGGCGNEIVSCIKNRRRWVATETNKRDMNVIINNKISDRKTIIEPLINQGV